MAWYDNPQILAEEMSFDDILCRIIESGELSKRELEVINFIYKARLLVCFQYVQKDWRRVKSYLDKFIQHLDRVIHPRRKKILNKYKTDYFTIWETYLKLLDDLTLICRDAEEEERGKRIVPSAQILRTFFEKAEKH